MGAPGPADLKALRTALCTRIPSEDDLDRFLAEEVEKRLAMVSKPGTRRNRVHETVKTTEAECCSGT